MSIQSRLEEYLSRKRLTYRRFESLCNIGNGVAATLSDRTRRDTLRRIAENCDLNVDWLLTGKGDMINPDFVSPQSHGDSGDSVLIPTVVFNVLKKQADTLKEQSESLKTRDELLSRMVSLLEAERADRATTKPQPTEV